MPLSDRRRRLAARLHRRKTRLREGLVLVEGVRACREALRAGAAIRFVCATERALVGRLAKRCWRTATELGADRHLVSEREMRAISDTLSPQGFLLVCEEPSWTAAAALEGGRILVLDRIRDPGNLGALLRTAAALGMDGALTLDGSVDLWGTKAVRASAGAAFHLPVAELAWPDAERELGRIGARILVADSSGDAPPEEWPSPSALVVGGENQGARKELRAAAHGVVAVPMRRGLDSLNAAAAGAVLMWEMLKNPERSR